MRRYRIGAICAAVAVFSLGWTMGRRTAPAKVVENVVTKTVEAERAGTSSQAVASVQRAESTRTRVVTRIVTKPGGERLVERWRDTGSDSQSAAATSTVVVQYRDRWHAAEKQETRITVSKDVRWHLTAMAGYTYDWRREYGGALSLRTIGPVSLTVWGTNHAAGLGLTVSW